MSVVPMSSARRRRIAGAGVVGSAFHWIGKKLNGEEALKTPQGWLYLNKTAPSAPVYRGGVSPGGYNARLFGGRIRRKKRRVRR